MGLKRWAPALLVLLVLLAHWGAGELIGHWDSGWRADAAMPARIDVAFVRELKPALLRAPAAVAHKPRAAGIATLKDEVPQLPALPPLDIPPPPEPAASTLAAADEGEPGPEWPLSTRLDYRLSGNYRGEITGSASVEWLREGAHYQVRLELSVGGLISRSMVSDGVLTAHGIEPRRYEEETRVLLMAPRRASMRFDGSQLQLANGQQMAKPPGVQDSASQFVHLTWVFLTGRKALHEGNFVDMPLALPRKLYDWRYEVLGRETLDTPMGPLDSWHLRPTRGDAPIHGDLTADVWLAPTLQYLPVRILIRQDPQTFVDLQLAKAPVQESATSKAPQSAASKPGVSP